MLTIQRRTVLGGLAGLGVAAPLWAQTAPKGKLAPKLRIVIPAMSRTALDEAGRALGDALVGQGLSDEIEYENKEGGGGTAGLAWYVQKYNADPNTLLMGDSNLVGAIALQKPAVDLTKVKPVARADQRLPGGGGGGRFAHQDHQRTGGAPAHQCQTDEHGHRCGRRRRPCVRGPAGESRRRQARRRGLPALRAQLRAGGCGDGGQGGGRCFQLRHLQGGAGRRQAARPRCLFQKAAYGVKSVREQGLDVDLTNWRAVFTGAGVPAARQAEMVEGVKASLAYELWKKTLKESYWEQSWMSGPDLGNFIDFDVKTTQLMVQLLKLKA